MKTYSEIERDAVLEAADLRRKVERLKEDNKLYRNVTKERLNLAIDRLHNSLNVACVKANVMKAYCDFHAEMIKLQKSL